MPYICLQCNERWWYFTNNRKILILYSLQTFFWPFMAFLMRWLERWQEMGWRRTCSEGPQVGLEPSAAAATADPLYMRVWAPLNQLSYRGAPGCKRLIALSPDISRRILNVHIEELPLLLHVRSANFPVRSRWHSVWLVTWQNKFSVSEYNFRTSEKWPKYERHPSSHRALSVTKAVGAVWCMCPVVLWDSSLCCFMQFVMKGPPSRAHTVKALC